MDKKTPASETDPKLIEVASGIVSAYIRNNHLSIGDLRETIRNIHHALASLGSASAGNTSEDRKPATSIKKSVMPDHLVCLEDGKKLTMLKRYLRTRYNLSPEQYRDKWNLPHDYPMVSPNYAAYRSNLAKKSGLGRTSNKSVAARNVTTKTTAKKKRS
ncbi:MAG TPA: MucR family transcriptional regulator [Rhizomicrobium sp.]